MNEHPSLLSVEGVCKRYTTVQAVDNISFTVRAGEIFGLLGPNGAGKTTTIRMILDIIRPDAGHIDVLGGPMSEEKKARIGYLPEERGLYADMGLLEVLVFLGQLKDLRRSTACKRAETYLREVELWDVKERKIKELSRGMGQKAQFVAAILHEPDLIIVDEPFNGLDPVNTRIIKGLIYGMRDRGAGVIMSTHQMHQVEEMCQRILLMNHGKQVLHGPLQEIRRRFSAHAVEVTLQGQLEQIPGVQRIGRHNGAYRLLLEEAAQPERILQTLVQMPDVTIERFERVETSLDEIFVQVVGGPVGDEDERS